MFHKITSAGPSVTQAEIDLVTEAVREGWGEKMNYYIDQFIEEFSAYVGIDYCLPTSHCNDALHLAMLAMEIEPGDEVIVPTLTFIAPINAICHNNAIPVFMDADNYYNMDAEKTIDFIRKETIYKDGFTYNKITHNKISAILPVHVWGNACFFDELVELFMERNIAIVEDASESLGTFYNDGKLPECRYYILAEYS